MIDLVGKKISRLDSSQEGVAKIQQLWAKLLGFNHRETLSTARKELTHWVEEHQTGEEFPQRFTQIFQKTGLVVGDDF